MTMNTEIEFKCPINEKQYNRLVKDFELENNVFKQTNYYFDTEDKQFQKEGTVLRIRHKHPNHFKVTLKTKTPQGALESHVFLNQNQTENMIKNGFNVKDYFDIDRNVILFGRLDNYRVSTPYKDGELFFDKVEYFGHVDFEVEYEVDNYEQGKNDFYEFLASNNIEVKPALRKSNRILNYKK